MKSYLPLTGLLSLSIVVFMVGCLCGKKATEIRVSAGEEFKLPIGKTAILKDTDLKLTFSEVLEDSRCPLYTNCIWEGLVRIKITLENSGNETALEFTRKGKETTPLTESIGNQQIQLLVVEPYPEAGKHIRTEDYAIQLLIN